MIKAKVAFLEGRLFNQSGFYENFSDCSD